MQRLLAVRWSDYFIAIVVSTLALILRGLLDPILGDDFPYAFSIFALLIISSNIGFFATLLALAIGLIGARFFFVPPRQTLISEDPRVTVNLIFLVLCGFVCAWMGSKLRRWQHRATEHRDELIQQRVINQNELIQRREIELDRDRKEMELRESQEIFRKLVEMVPQFVWMTDPQGNVLYFNHRWYEFTGMVAEETLGEGWLAAIHPDDQSRTIRRWEQAISSGEIYEIEYRLRAADGSYRWFLGRGDAFRDVTGKIVQWFGTCTDIDDQRRMTESLDQLVLDRTQQLVELNNAMRLEIEERKALEERERLISLELRRSNEELEKFAYVASHDLQEPLRKIQSFGDRLNSRARANLDETSQDYLERILRASGRMRRLIDDLLSFSRVSTKKRTPVPVDLNVVLKEVLLDLEVAISQAGANVQTGELPTIDADSFQMQQLFQNLIGNALKFRKPNSTSQINISGRVISETIDDNHVFSRCELKFADNGIGFDEKYLDRIFQVFQRLHGRSDYEGTGIGLAICRKIVERHGGSITAESKPHEGATFIVTLPLTPVVEQERTQNEESSQTRDDPRRGR